MVDIDKVVCDFCHAHLEANKGAFESPRLELINDDARAQLEASGGGALLAGGLGGKAYMRMPARKRAGGSLPRALLLVSLTAHHPHDHIHHHHIHHHHHHHHIHHHHQHTRRSTPASLT